MKKSEAFPSRFFKAEDVKEQPLVLTIKRLYQDQIGIDKQEKNILAFVETEKELVLNGTNWDSIADIVGSDDSDDWPSYKIMLIEALVDFKGQKRPGIRVRSPNTAQASKAPAKRSGPPPLPSPDDYGTGGPDDDFDFRP